MNSLHSTKLFTQIVMIVLLLGALNNMAYGYYKIANSFVCCGFITLLAIDIYRKQLLLIPIYLLGMVAFNPLIKLGFKRTDWLLLDKIAIVSIVIISLYDAFKSNK